MSVRLPPLATCCVVLIAALTGCRSSHDTEAFYTVRADAEQSAEFDRGWLPEFLPTSSHAIHLAYDLSPSEVWCAFEFDPADSGKLLNSLKLVDPLALPIMRIPSPEVTWWPKSLEGDLDVQRIRGGGLALYSTTRPVSDVINETLVFGVDQTKRARLFLRALGDCGRE
jgi:hypothetical protein